MSYNPAFDPRKEQGKIQNQADPQFQVDQQYAREVREGANSQTAGYGQASYVPTQQPNMQYNQPQPVGVYTAPAQSHAATYYPVSSTPMPVTRTQSIPTPVTRTEVNTYEAPRLRDRVRWGPILAGLFATLATLLLLSLLGVAVGLTAATGDPNGGAVAATDKANNYGTGAAIWAAVSAIIAFFIGGYVAAHTAGIRGKDNGWINGAMVWAIALPLLLWFASSGASGFLNAIGFNLHGFTNTISNTVNNPSTNPVNTDPAAVQRATEAARNGAWGALLALLLGLAAASLGGFVGGRNHKDDLDENDGASRVGGKKQSNY